MGASNGAGGVTTSKAATATIGFASTNGGRVTLANVAANPSATLAAPEFAGVIQAALPLVSGDGLTTASPTVIWNLGSGVSPTVTGGTQVAALNVTPSSLLTATQITSVGALGLQQLGQWAGAITAAAGQSVTLGTSLPLLGQSVIQLTGLTNIVDAIAAAVQAYAISGTGTTHFEAAITGALAEFDAANPGFKLTLDPSQTYGGLIPAADTGAAEDLGLTTGTDKLYFNLAVTACHTGTRAITLSGGATGTMSRFPATCLTPPT